MLESAILAIILDTHTRLEIQSISQRGRIRRLEYFRVQHIHQGRSHAAGRFIPVGRHYDAVQRHGVLFRLEVHLDGLTLLQFDLLLYRLISDGFHHDRKGSFGKIRH